MARARKTTNKRNKQKSKREQPAHPALPTPQRIVKTLWERKVSAPPTPRNRLKNARTNLKKRKLRNAPSHQMGRFVTPSRADIANLLVMVKNLKEQVEGQNAKLIKASSNGNSLRRALSRNARA